jgi:2-keto-4-pentenoate hydratase/2-oxohepta-3-ene-1,7-dioic acid hydratase in catechol pathway
VSVREELPEADARSLPIARPSKIIAVGLNYVDHAGESKMDVPEQPLLFAKWPNALIGDGEAIRLPPHTEQVDFEAELGVVIGEPTRGPVQVERALEIVAGYLCLNDVSARDVQFGDGQWTRGKSFDTFCPVGPTLVPAAQIQDPQALRIRALLNDEVMQDATTADMIFSVAEIIAYVSASISLEVGDIIASGTPPGVGFARTPPVYLRPGDVVAVEIEGVGTLTNPVVAA